MKGKQKTKFSTLFSPLSIGSLKLRNRVVMAPMGTNFSHEDGTISNRAIAYYVERAKGGAGLIITESSPTSHLARHRAQCVCAYDDSFLPGLLRLVNAVHEHGAAIALQLIHAGRHMEQNLTGIPPLAPSPIPRWPGAPIPKELSFEEIEQIIVDFGKVARRAKEAGFDAVEIHGAHGYLITLFLSPRTNKRKDRYGGNSQNRLRFALEVLREVRKQVGDTFPVIFRISAKEYIEGGYELEEALDWCKELERAGASAIHVTGGTNETLLSGVHAVSPMVFPAGYHVPLAEAVKKVVQIPIIAVDLLNDPMLAEQVLREGKADLVAVGRGFLSDPHWPAKALREEEDRIRFCVACNECVWTLYQQADVMCFQNATVGLEKEYQIHPAKKSKKVLVIGGGPGGMEAARVARKRGHHVILYEKTQRLGGQMLLAAVPPHRQNLLKAIEWLIREVEREEVDVRLNTEANAESVAAKKPDAVILATGASPIFPNSFNGPNIVTAWEVLEGRETARQVLILGGGMVGVETAEFLYERGCQVTVVEMLDELAIDMEGITRSLFMERLASSNISVMLLTKVDRVRDGRVLISKDGKKEWLDAETIVLALGSQPNQALLKELEGKVPEIISTGDCVEPRKSKEAIHEGFLAGLKL